MATDRQERIRHRAHEIWERQGRPHGSDQQHWDEATREIDAEDAATKKPAARAGVSKPAKSAGKAASPVKKAPTKAKTPK
jgi:hypothetical protein